MNGICIFEDSGYEGLLPLVYTRPVYRLRSGILNLEEKILHSYPGVNVSLFCRDYLKDVLEEENKYRQVTCKINNLDAEAEGYLFVNGRILEWEPVPLEGPEEVGISSASGGLVYGRLGRERCKELVAKDFVEGKALKKLEGVPKREVSPVLVRYFWDIVKHNREEIKRDWERLF
ncbi:MAG TPA: putative sugar nucleotidyl transferase, partial [Candidatus Hypogeohydataceae bacterium YC41]